MKNQLSKNDMLKYMEYSGHRYKMIKLIQLFIFVLIGCYMKYYSPFTINENMLYAIVSAGIGFFVVSIIMNVRNTAVSKSIMRHATSCKLVEERCGIAHYTLKDIQGKSILSIHISVKGYKKFMKRGC